MIAIVQDRQTVFDLALQYLGSAEACFFVAEKLGISVTDMPAPGASFEYETSDIVDPHVVDYYRKNGIVPATEI